MPSIIALLASYVRRLGRWIIAADCTCGMKNANDCAHATGCPHPLQQPHVRDEPQHASVTIYTSGGRKTRRRKAA